ncbi:MAG: SRPBCC family protein [Actinomycetota bacterium]
MRCQVQLPARATTLETIAEHHATVVINRPVSDVWAFVTDLSETPRWRTSVTTVEPPETLAVGAEFGATSRVLGRNWSWRLRITTVTDNQELGYEVVDGMVDIDVHYRLDEVGGGCRFTLSGRSRPSNLPGRLLDRAGAWQLKREMDGQVQELKRILEVSTT